MKRIVVLTVATFLLCASLGFRADEPAPPKEEVSKEVAAAREKGLDWLTKNQAKDGSWGKTFTIAVTSFACLTYLSASDEPFTGERGEALVKGLNFLMKNQKDGNFSLQKNNWIHIQGFGTLALSEAYGRSLFAKTKPDMDMKKVKEVVAKAVQEIEKAQAPSGGWWYTAKPKGIGIKGAAVQEHEGSTTVCAVQAIVSAGNYGIPTDAKVLEKGFDYLKKCQTEQGGFNYKQGDGRNMKEGTAADMATLGLMNKFDNQVMLKAYKFLLEVTPENMSKERYPDYGHFYGAMAMHLLGQEFGEAKEFRDRTGDYITRTQKEIINLQDKDGAIALKGSLKGKKKNNAKENDGYSTAYGTLTLFVPAGRLSIYRRTQPELPKE